ncbi:MAG: 50S ribosomal protein L30 [Gammaproteobacteria bacterium]|nr:50S ribosomal protein L30 [Gammaproteobacteria bacterium]
MASGNLDKKTVKVTLVRSTNGRLKRHKACVRGLGLRRLHQTVEVEDTPCTRGMINKVSYMVRVEEA